MEDLLVPAMKTITISRRARSVHNLLKRARKENVILRSPEGEEFILAEVDDFNREIELARQNRALMRFLDARARRTETVSPEEARGLLGLARSRRSA
jgi:hypothetical protein